MSDLSQQLSNTLWAIADQLRGAMNVDNFPDSGGCQSLINYRCFNIHCLE
jgi:type I restriction-modification system DNA methylase subunit